MSVAALPMYDWPEVRAETDALWAAIGDGLRNAGLDAPAGIFVLACQYIRTAWPKLP